MEYRQLIKNGKIMMYSIIRKQSKNITAKVNNKNEVIVTCPAFVPIDKIDEFILGNFEKFFTFIDYKEKNSLINWKNDYISLNGVKHDIKIIDTIKREKYEIINNKIYLHLKDKDNKMKIMKKLLFDLGNDYLIKRTIFLSKKHKISFCEVKTKWYETKWGQCDYRKKAITLASQLYMFNEELIDYVIIHELCHLVHPDHSNSFWSLVEEKYPNYKIAKNKLKFEC